MSFLIWIWFHDYLISSQNTVAFWPKYLITHLQLIVLLRNQPSFQYMSEMIQTFTFTFWSLAGSKQFASWYFFSILHRYLSSLLKRLVFEKPLVVWNSKKKIKPYDQHSTWIFGFRKDDSCFTLSNALTPIWLQQFPKTCVPFCSFNAFR